MARQRDSDRDRRERMDDGRSRAADDETTGNPYHASRGTRTFLRIVALLLVVSMTALFLRGIIHT